MGRKTQAGSKTALRSYCQCTIENSSIPENANKIPAGCKVLNYKISENIPNKTEMIPAHG